MIMKKLFIIALLFLSIQKIFCHTPVKDVVIMVGGQIISNVNYIGLAPELSVTALVFNAGLAFQFKKSYLPDNTVYLGMGLLNLLQIQYGFSNENKIRLCSELPVLSGSPIFKKNFDNWRDKLNLILTYEFNLKKSYLNQIGIGLSYAIN